MEHAPKKEMLAALCPKLASDLQRHVLIMGFIEDVV
jgi:hypothetical protein